MELFTLAQSQLSWQDYGLLGMAIIGLLTWNKQLSAKVDNNARLTTKALEDSRAAELECREKNDDLRDRVEQLHERVGRLVGSEEAYHKVCEGIEELGQKILQEIQSAGGDHS